MKNYQEHAHARVCSALTYSVLQCPGVMPGFTGDWHMGPLSGLCLQAPGIKQALAPLWTMDDVRRRMLYIHCSPQLRTAHLCADRKWRPWNRWNVSAP